MTQKETQARPVPGGLTAPAECWPADVAGVLWKVEGLLQQGRPADALELVRRSQAQSPWLANAAAVCRLRLGDAAGAVPALRGLVMDGVFYRDGTPAVFKANLAAALIAEGNLPSGLRVLAEARDEAHPAVAQVREAVRRWEAGMTFWQRLWWSLGGAPPRPLVLDFPPGRLG